MKQKKAVLLTALAVLLVYGCQRSNAGIGGFAPETNSIYITKDGEIASGMVETFDKGKSEHYQQESLENFVFEEVALFNESLGAQKASQNEEGKEPLPVAVRSCKLRENQVTAVYQYRDSQSLLAFWQRYFGMISRMKNFEVCSVEDARLKGWLTAAEFVKPLKDGEVKPPETQELERLGKGQMVLVESDYPVEIQVEGRIRYMTKGIETVDKHTVQVPAGVHYLIFW